jgi:hypothetical protein
MTASRLPDNDPDLAYASAVEAASESDRRWFERHPGETERWRPAGLGDGPRPGEPLLVTGRRWDGPQQMITCVHQIKPDVRVRRCFLAPARWPLGRAIRRARKLPIDPQMAAALRKLKNL